MSNEPQVKMFIPALAVLLGKAELELRRPLTREEVEAICDRGTWVMVPQWSAAVIRSKRGFDDIDPGQAWEEWQGVRELLSSRRAT